jgi:ring-1,2-phenylacetyl-CoA epoxidase subunit PaaE
MVIDARAALSQRDVADAATHTELFHVEDQPAVRVRAPEAAAVGASVTILLDGRTSNLTVAPGERILDAALRSRPELPYACKGGVCSTCRAQGRRGRVEMARNFALEPDELAAGYVSDLSGDAVTERVCGRLRRMKHPVDRGRLPNERT